MNESELRDKKKAGIPHRLNDAFTDINAFRLYLHFTCKKIHLHIADTGNLLRNFLHTRRTGRTGHSADIKFYGHTFTPLFSKH